MTFFALKTRNEGESISLQATLIKRNCMKSEKRKRNDVFQKTVTQPPKVSGWLWCCYEVANRLHQFQTV